LVPSSPAIVNGYLELTGLLVARHPVLTLQDNGAKMVNDTVAAKLPFFAAVSTREFELTIHNQKGETGLA